MSGRTPLERYYERYWADDSPRPKHDPLTAPRLRLLRDELARVERIGSVFDAGCGTGDVLAALAGDGLDATGIDLSAAAVERAATVHPEIDVYRHSVDDLPWPVEPGSQDLVVAFEVVEHLFAPRLLLEGAREALRPGGYLALSTPYHGRLKSTLLALAAFERHFDVEGQHVRFFTDASLLRLVRECGFDVLRVRHLGRGPLVWANTFLWGRRR